MLKSYVNIYMSGSSFAVWILDLFHKMFDIFLLWTYKIIFFFLTSDVIIKVCTVDSSWKGWDKLNLIMNGEHELVV